MVEQIKTIKKMLYPAKGCCIVTVPTYIRAQIPQIRILHPPHTTVKFRIAPEGCNEFSG